MTSSQLGRYGVGAGQVYGMSLGDLAVEVALSGHKP